MGEYRPLDALLAEADVVSLHLPLVPETERLIDAAALTRMRTGAVLINTARGGLVDQTALTAALASGGGGIFKATALDAAEALKVDAYARGTVLREIADRHHRRG